MRLLLDTNVLIWALCRVARLSPRDLARIRDSANDVAFSPASIWEIAIKAASRRPDFDVDPRDLLAAVRSNFREICVSSSTAIRAAYLPLHHRDPFDRLLVAQALDDGSLLLTADRVLSAYGSHALIAE